MRKTLLLLVGALSISEGAQVAVPPPANVTAPCDPTNIITGMLGQGVNWTYNVNDLNSVSVLSSTGPVNVPTGSQILAQISTCQTTQLNQSALQLELSTTVTSVSAYPNIVGPTATQQSQVTRDMARIQAIKQLLGFQ